MVARRPYSIVSVELMSSGSVTGSEILLALTFLTVTVSDSSCLVESLRAMMCLAVGRA